MIRRLLGDTINVITAKIRTQNLILGETLVADDCTKEINEDNAPSWTCVLYLGKTKEIILTENWLFRYSAITAE